MSTWPNTCTIDGILLDVDDGSSFRVVENLTGWDDSPGIRSGLSPKSGQDGAWDASGQLSERVIEVAGLVEESSKDAARAVARELSALRPQSLYSFVVADSAGSISGGMTEDPSGSGLFDTTLVESPPGSGLYEFGSLALDVAVASSLSAQVRVTVGLKADWLDDSTFTYSLQLTAPDPLRYGLATFGTATLSTATPGAGLTYPLTYPRDYGIPPGVTPGAVPVANVGTAPYWPRLRIAGPVTNPVVTLVETGSWLRYGGSLLAGQWLDIDLANRTVLLQGLISVRSKVTSSGDWLGVPPGGGSITWSADSADPAALLSVWSYEGAWS